MTASPSKKSENKNDIGRVNRELVEPQTAYRRLPETTPTQLITRPEMGQKRQIISPTVSGPA
jgi:hypothetical protein